MATVFATDAVFCSSRFLAAAFRLRKTRQLSGDKPAPRLQKPARGGAGFLMILIFFVQGAVWDGEIDYGGLGEGWG